VRDEEGAVPRFLLAYRGGSVPDPEQQAEVMNAWFAWFAGGSIEVGETIDI
jgi:hypothetical protein